MRTLLSGLLLSLIFSCTETPSESQLPVPSEGKTTPEAYESPRVEENFSGILPCKNCQGIKTTITLLPDSTFLMKEVFLQIQGKKHDSLTTFGKWLPLPGKLVLDAGKEWTRMYGKQADTALIPLDPSGEPIPGTPNFHLHKVPDSLHIAEPVLIMGMLWSDSLSIFTECITQKSYHLTGKVEDMQKTFNRRYTKKTFARIKGYPQGKEFLVKEFVGFYPKEKCP